MRCPRVISTIGSCLVLAACGGGAPSPAQPATTAPTSPASNQATSSAAATPPPGASGSKGSTADTLKILFDGLTAGDTKKMTKAYADTAIILTNGQSKIVRDQMDIEQPMLSGLSDIKATVIRTFTRNDIEIVEWELTAKNTGDIGDHKASGKAVALRMLNYFDFDDSNMIQEEHAYFDSATFFGQIDPGSAAGAVRSASFTPPGSVEARTAKGTADETANAAAMKNWYGLLNGHKVALYDLIGDDEVLDEGGPETKKGKNDVRNVFWYYQKAVPDISDDFTPPLAFEDFTFSEVVMHGTLKGSLGPVQPTGNPFKTHRADLMQWKGGKIVNAWTYSDFNELRDQVNPKKKP